VGHQTPRVTCALRRRAVVASIESAVVEAGMDDVTVDAFPDDAVGLVREALKLA
jgi:hypothetical protein